MFYELSETGVFVCDAPSVAGLKDWTQVSPPQPCHSPRFIGDRLETGEWLGEWVDDGPKPIPPLVAAKLEKFWRNAELKRADVELNKVQDGVGTGTVAGWRAYRCALRDWPAHEKFPDEDYRPVAPK